MIYTQYAQIMGKISITRHISLALNTKGESKLYFPKSLVSIEAITNKWLWKGYKCQYEKSGLCLGFDFKAPIFLFCESWWRCKSMILFKGNTRVMGTEFHFGTIALSQAICYSSAFQAEENALCLNLNIDPKAAINWAMVIELKTHWNFALWEISVQTLYHRNIF